MGMNNTVILDGCLGRAPEVRYTEAGNTVVSFSLATNDRGKLDDGTYGEKTEWHRCVCFGRTAEAIEKCRLDKGAGIKVSGSLETRKWEKDGETRYTTEIVFWEWAFNGKGTRRDENAPGSSGNQGNVQGNGTQQPRPAPQAGVSDFNDDIPF